MIPNILGILICVFMIVFDFRKRKYLWVILWIVILAFWTSLTLREYF